MLCALAAWTIWYGRFSAERPAIPSAEEVARYRELTAAWGPELEEAFSQHFARSPDQVELSGFFVRSVNFLWAVAQVDYRRTGKCNWDCFSDWQGEMIFVRLLGRWHVFQERYWEVIYSDLQ